jgi:hypothetical protein
MRKIVLGTTLSAALFVGLLEGLLRLAPFAIPLDLLRHFEPQLRGRVAARRHLPVLADTVPVSRDDGGPQDVMWIYKGGVEVTKDYPEPGIVKTVRMDDTGFCNPDPRAYDAPTFDVIAVGDSFTFCTSVEPRDTWPIVFAELSGLSTYNLGLPGRGLYEYVQALKRFGLPKSPKWVVLNVYEGNDLRDAVRYHAVKTDRYAETATAACPFAPAGCARFAWLRDGAAGRHSYAFDLVAATVWELAYKRQKRDIDFTYVVRSRDGAAELFNSRNRDRDEVLFAKLLVDGAVRVGVLDEALHAYLALAVEHRFVPIVAYTPSAYTAYETMAEFDNPELHRIMRAYSDLLRAYFREQAARLGYPYLDLTDTLRAEAERRGPREPLYFRTNVHLTQLGHRVVAREIAALVRQLGR